MTPNYTFHAALRVMQGSLLCIAFITFGLFVGCASGNRTALKNEEKKNHAGRDVKETTVTNIAYNGTPWWAIGLACLGASLTRKAVWDGIGLWHGKRKSNRARGELGCSGTLAGRSDSADSDGGG